MAASTSSGTVANGHADMYDVAKVAHFVGGLQVSLWEGRLFGFAHGVWVQWNVEQMLM